MQGQCIVTEPNFDRLNKLLQSRLCRISNGVWAYNLEQNLSQSEVVAPQKIPRTVVTMNSTVSIRDEDSGEQEVYTLVYPQDEDIDRRMLSVFSPLGTALLGKRINEVIKLGIRRIHVEKILYQPEAAGDFHYQLEVHDRKGAMAGR